VEDSARRKWQRFPAAAQVRVQVLDRDAPVSVVLGPVRDMSAAGVFVLSSTPPALHAKVRVYTRLPTTGMILENSGEVVRVEPEGFAVRFDNAIRTGKTLPDG